MFGSKLALKGGGPTRGGFAGRGEAGAGLCVHARAPAPSTTILVVPKDGCADPVELALQGACVDPGGNSSRAERMALLMPSVSALEVYAAAYSAAAFTRCQSRRQARPCSRPARVFYNDVALR